VERELGVRPELVKGRGGDFEVALGNDLVFSKRRAGRFPQPGEVVAELRRRGAGG
jgi:selT/selW/selH-like putative selenoprotein